MKLGIPMLAAALVLGSVALAEEPRPNPTPEPKQNTNTNTDQQSPSPGAYNQPQTQGLTMAKGQVVSADSRSNTLVVKVDKAPGGSGSMSGTTGNVGSTGSTGTGTTGSTGAGSSTGMGQQSEMSFVVGPDTKILKGSKKASLSEISGGDKVTVNYKMVGGKNMAVSIGIEPTA